MKRHLVLILAVTLLVGLAGGSPGSAALTDNLIGYWAFDGSGADGSGNDRGVTLYGTAGYASGLFGQALSLPGLANSYAARTADDAAYNFGSSDFTVQVWVNFNTLNNEQTLIEKFTGGAGPGWTVTKPGNYVQFYSSVGQMNSTNVITDLDDWHQVVVRRNGSDFSLFVDDTETTMTGSGAISASPNPLLIGERQGDQNFPVNGLIDEAAIWSRALTDGEVTYLYNGGEGNPVSAVPLPSTLSLLGLGLAGLSAIRFRLSK